MKINNLSIRNLKKVKDIKISSAGKNIVILEGKNAAGKTSVMDSIAMALGGSALIPDVPIRHGQEDAEIVVETDEYTAKRRFLKSGSTVLELKTKEGGKVKSAQTILNDLIGELSFDPMEFCQKKRAERVNILKDITGLDFSDLDEEYVKKFEERTFLYRNVRNLKAELVKYQDVKRINLEDISEIQEKRKKAVEHNQHVKEKRQAHVDLEKLIISTDEKITKLTNELNYLKEIQANNKAAFEANIEIIDADYIINLDEFDSKIKEHSENAALNERWKIKVDTKERLESNEEKGIGISDRLRDINNEKARLISEANMPIPGLAFDKDVTFDGVEFEEISFAQKIKVSMAMAMALNPKLKVIRIMNGSLLDSDTFKEIERIAEEKDFQVWIERVADKKSGDAIFIEDGEIIN